MRRIVSASLLDCRSNRKTGQQAFSQRNDLSLWVAMPSGVSYRVWIAELLFPCQQRFRADREHPGRLIHLQIARLPVGWFHRIRFISREGTRVREPGHLHVGTRSGPESQGEVEKVVFEGTERDRCAASAGTGRGSSGFATCVADPGERHEAMIATAPDVVGRSAHPSAASLATHKQWPDRRAGPCVRPR